MNHLEREGLGILSEDCRLDAEKIAGMVDAGTVEYLEGDWLDGAAEKAARMNAGA